MHKSTNHMLRFRPHPMTTVVCNRNLTTPVRLVIPTESTEIYRNNAFMIEMILRKWLRSCTPLSARPLPARPLLARPLPACPLPVRLHVRPSTYLRHDSVPGKQLGKDVGSPCEANNGTCLRSSLAVCLGRRKFQFSTMWSIRTLHALSVVSRSKFLCKLARGKADDAKYI